MEKCKKKAEPEIWMIILIISSLLAGYLIGVSQEHVEVSACELRAYSSMEFCTRMMDLQTKYYLSECNETRIK
jgi:hypothetical protein